MKKNSYLISILFCSLFSLGSCIDLLNEEPDTRDHIDTPNKLGRLLTTAYAECNPAVICEFSADNIIDNNAYLPQYSGSAYSTMNDELFKWEDVKTASTQDSPYYVWERSYYAIAACNHALEAIEEMVEKGGWSETDAALLNAYKGEALVARAYNHFVLVNVFAQAYFNDDLSKHELGVPYVTEPEKTVFVDYKRDNVAEVYRKIEKDLLDGIELIDDGAYTVPIYHFNTKAANAFAARFYLYKREYSKVVEYATKALGESPASIMRDWSPENIDNTNYVSMRNCYYATSNSCNFMLATSVSTMYRMIRDNRYAHNGLPFNVTTFGGHGPVWDYYLPCYEGRVYTNGSQENGGWLFKIYEYFEYADKIAGIGYAHALNALFTAEETLLCRAEAYLYLAQEGDAAAKDNAIRDLDIWCQSKLCNSTLTEAEIKGFYTKGKEGYVHEFNLPAGCEVLPEFKAFFDCVLHFRRMETAFEGLRWFDIKRYGIEVVHEFGKDKVRYVLAPNDQRRAIQIPQDVIQMGMVPNPRTDVAYTDNNVEKYIIEKE